MEAKQPRRALRLPEVKLKTGLGKTQIFQAVAEGKLPSPLKFYPAVARSRGTRERSTRTSRVEWPNASSNASLENETARFSSRAVRLLNQGWAQTAETDRSFPK